MLKALSSLLDKSNPVNIAFLGEEDAYALFIRNYCDEKGVNCVFLREYPVAKWGFGGEYFEAIVITQAFTEEALQIKKLKQALLKNQHIIYLSSTETAQELKPTLEPWGFSDICTILQDNVNINLIKKWFTFEQ